MFGKVFGMVIQAGIGALHLDGVVALVCTASDADHLAVLDCPTVAPTGPVAAAATRVSPALGWPISGRPMYGGTAVGYSDYPRYDAPADHEKNPREHFPGQEADPEQIGVCVSIIQDKVGLSQSTVSLYLVALQRAQLVSSQRIGPWTYYKRNEASVGQLFTLLGARI